MAKTATRRTTSSQPTPQFDRVAATCAALVVVGLAVFLLVRNEEIADPRLFFVLRVVVSFATATLGATIPGFLEIGWSGRGLAIRAGGARPLRPDLSLHAGSRDTAGSGRARDDQRSGRCRCRKDRE